MKRYIRANKPVDKPSKVIFYNFTGKTIIPDILFDNLEDADQYACDRDWRVYKKWDGVSEVPDYI